ncbi:MAG: hypothetical protein WCY41_03075 [Candidatus Micrarchaeia archaeon]
MAKKKEACKMKMKPVVITQKHSEQYKKTLYRAVYNSVFYEKGTGREEEFGRNWKFCLEGKSSPPILFQSELAYDEKFLALVKFVNAAHQIIPESYVDGFQIDCHTSSKRGSILEIGRVAMKHVKSTHLMDWKTPVKLWRAWKDEKERFAPAAVEKQILDMLSEIADRVGLSEFHLLPRSEQT